MQSSRRVYCVMGRWAPSRQSVPFTIFPSSQPTISAVNDIGSRQYRCHRHCSHISLRRRYLPLQTPSLTSTSTSTIPRNLSVTRTTTARTMSDDAYTSFLDKANADLNAGQQSQSQSQQAQSTNRTDTEQIPSALKSFDAYYVSETDEPFEPVVLKWESATSGVWPDASQLSSLLSPDTNLDPSSITTLSPESFDPRKEYASVLRAVAQASGGGGDEVKVYRVEIGTSRVEYYVLGLDAGEGGRVVGLVTKAVES